MTLIANEERLIGASQRFTLSVRRCLTFGSIFNSHNSGESFIVLCDEFPLFDPFDSIELFVCFFFESVTNPTTCLIQRLF